MTSVGCRSGVHWTREEIEPSIEPAIARASTVFAVPGTSSKSTWPSHMSAASTSEEVFTATLLDAVGIDQPPPRGLSDRATTFASLDTLVGTNFFDPGVKHRLAIVFTDGERVVGLIHLGRPVNEPPAKERPSLDVYVEFLD